ncbi:YiiX/YebB-like N1pC/P60 family cysteine hydrolase [Haloferula sargassicola]|uniref:Permuted papain-like amidase enzyme, YaeF/YiiX, C92 family n=1 Tax=Haloferula sargassicola TaxID=490096 RepID=A0ABP9UUJ9_9BACT
MKAVLFLLLSSLLALAADPPLYDLREGDILFQGNKGPQSDAIRAATDSPYTHCGIVVEKNGQLAVFEAAQPVKVTPLTDFVSRSVPGTYKAMRLAQPIHPAWLAKAKDWAEDLIGEPYDFKFEWSDDAYYCSELVWKTYLAGGIELCKPKRFSDYDLEDPVVAALIEQRYGGIENLPLDEAAVAPGDLAASAMLAEVPMLPASQSTTPTNEP